MANVRVIRLISDLGNLQKRSDEQFAGVIEPDISQALRDSHAGFGLEGRIEIRKGKPDQSCQRFRLQFGLARLGFFRGLIFAGGGVARDV